MQAIDNLDRRFCRRKQTEPTGINLHPRHARFGECRHLRQRRETRATGHRQRAQFGRTDVWHRQRGIGEHRLDFTAKERGDRRPAAFVGHMRHAGFGTRIEQRAGQMHGVTDTGRGIRQLVIRPTTECDELLHVLRWHRWMHHQNKRLLRTDIGHRRKILQRVIRQFFIDARIHHKRRRHQYQRMAIGRGLGHRVGADNAIRTRAVVDHHRLAELAGELLGDDARNQIRPAGPKRHHHAHRTRRILPDLSRCRVGKKAGHGE